MADCMSSKIQKTGTTMQDAKKYTAIIIGIIAVIVITVLIIWLKPNEAEKTAPTNNTQPTDNTSINSNSNALSATPQPAGTYSSTSQQDTQINCQLKMDASNRLIVNAQTKDCFEYFITQYGEKSLEQLKGDFITYAKASYKDPLLSQLLDLWSRYLQYREQLGTVEKPNLNPEDPKYYRQIFSATQNLKKRFFSDYEIEGLFGEETTYDNYTLDRMDILADKTLTEQQKAEKLSQLFNTLPQEWQENLKQLNQLEDLRKLTSEIKARGGSSEEIRQMRLNLVGAEATQRLEKLDVQRNEWKNRVTDYLDQRDTIKQSSMSDAAKQEAINALRNKQFHTQQEQLRAETFETVHDQGAQLPFAE